MRNNIYKEEKLLLIPKVEKYIEYVIGIIKYYAKNNKE